MDIKQAIEQRHSVRQYIDKPIEGQTLAALEKVISDCNEESGLHIQLVTNEPKAFDSRMAHYGNFKGVKNYIATVGKKSADLDEKCGYYGEKIVLAAQMLGLNTCWVALTYKKIPGVFNVNSGEKLAIVISVGYGENQGANRKSKDIKDVSNCDEYSPEWFKEGMKAALLAPTAVNQQKFRITADGSRVSAKAGMAFYSKLDLGIVKYHFEIGAGKENFEWA
ncbi:MAG: nitroreductase [Clostridia bacterium]|nr:nitroreductase [Clostridia bacterium]